MSLVIRAENLKALRRFEWRPQGVCALVGPNGSGKSTALKLLEMLRQSMTAGYSIGLQVLGSGEFRNLDSPVTQRACVSVSFGGVTWEVDVERTDDPHDVALVHEVQVFSRNRRQPNFTASFKGQNYGMKAEVGELGLRSLLQRYPEQFPEMSRFAQLVRDARFFSRPDFRLLRESGSPSQSDTVLDLDARNLFSVLRNWRDLAEHDHRSAFVTDQMRDIFPRDFKRLDFSQVAQRTFASVVSPRWSVKLQPSEWSDGFFSMLVLLTALASGEMDSVVAIDEPENSLHPELIHRFIDAARLWSRTKRVTVVLATHSPVVLDQFREDPEQVHVMEPGRESLPVPLDQLKKREWLAHYALGDLYSHNEVGAPQP